MGDELDINIIKATQNSLGKYVKRPPLSDKLLRKPPFRFLHDIITCVLKSTGFFEGLFEEEELVSENVKDRERKIQFLNKIIIVVSTSTGKPLSVKASKIIAGQEPEKTNELLQCLASALEKKISSEEAVKQYKSTSSKSTHNDRKVKDIKKITKKGAEPKSVSKNEEKPTKIDKNNTANKTKSKETLKKESPPKKSLQVSKTTIRNYENSKQQKDNESTVDLNEKISSDTSNTGLLNDTQIIEDNESYYFKQNKSTINVSKAEDSINTFNSICDDEIISSLQENVPEPKQIELTKCTGSNINTENIKNKSDNITQNSIKDVKNEQDNSSAIAVQASDDSKNIADNIDTLSNISTYESNNVESTKMTRPLSVRPSSSRPGAPRIRDKNEETLTESDNLLIGKVNIIVENTVQEEDESSIIIIEESTSPPITNVEQVDSPANEHGHLVQQILNSQKEFSQIQGKTEIEWQFGAKKARDVINQEIEQLRFNVQALARVANPLGKLLDHIQEDVEVMRQELHQWTTTYEQASKELIKQKANNEELFIPFHSKLKQLDVDIVEKQEKINDLKIIIHKNAHRIDRLLTNNGNMQQ